jgi:hypothetical protein
MQLKIDRAVLWSCNLLYRQFVGFPNGKVEELIQFIPVCMGKETNIEV